jgi:hypothetical protein
MAAADQLRWPPDQLRWPPVNAGSPSISVVLSDKGRAAPQRNDRHGEAFMSFSMPVRSKATSGALRRRRMNSVSADRRSAEPAPTRLVHDRQPGERSRRLGGTSQDRALYSCGCGYAFDAFVSTSVDCPHCGDRQAW